MGATTLDAFQILDSATEDPLLFAAKVGSCASFSWNSSRRFRSCFAFLPIRSQARKIRAREPTRTPVTIPMVRVLVSFAVAVRPFWSATPSPAVGRLSATAVVGKTEEIEDDSPACFPLPALVFALVEEVCAGAEVASGTSTTADEVIFAEVIAAKDVDVAKVELGDPRRTEDID